MKIVKNILNLLMLTTIVVGCTEKYDDTSFISKETTPTNISAYFDITQDNSGLVTIYPMGDGCTAFDIFFGDNSENSTSIMAGKNTQHTYAEGEYNVKIVAYNNAGKTTENEIPLTVSFRIPENLEITVENDAAISKKVNISATANYACTMDFYFGEEDPENPTVALPGETVSHTYAAAGDYSIRVIAKSGGALTLDSTFTFTVTGGPASAAPTPSNRRASDVISIFSDAYTQVAGTDFNPNWGQSTVVTTVSIGGDNTLKYSNLNYQGTALASAINVSSMEYLHVDVWTEDATTVNFYCISPGPAEKAYSFAIESGVWKSYDIPLSYFSDVVDLTNIFQFKVDGTSGSNVYFDNIYFYRETPTSPSEAAPIPPTRDPSKVISIFSNAYTDLTGTDFNPNWGQATVVTTEVIDGNSTLKYSNLNYQGTTFASSIDASSFGYLHIDMWTADATTINVSAISPGPVEKAYSLPITAGQWVSYDIPLTKFSDVVDLSDIFQFKFDGTAGSTIYLDNIYFY
ncbi:MAG: hypothetical protein AB7S50_14610 [Bacteroidales bacterium]